MTDELKPCPFCGEQHEDTHAYQPDYHHYWLVCCGACGATSPCHAKTDQGAIQKWNTRATPTPDDAARALDAVIKTILARVNDIQQYTNEFWEMEIGEDMDDFCKSLDEAADTIQALLNKPAENVGAGLNLKDLEKANLERQKDWRSENWSLGEWMCALTGEVGEAANIVKKIFRGDVSLNQAREALGKEFADILTYLSITAEKAGIDLSQVTIDKFNEVSERVGSDVKLPALSKDTHVDVEGLKKLLISDIENTDEYDKYAKQAAIVSVVRFAKRIEKGHLTAIPEWQPIDTAPKDGADVLLYWQYTYHKDKNVTHGIELGFYDDGHWDCGEPISDEIITHWMPLPQPPAAAQEGE